MFAFTRRGRRGPIAPARPRGQIYGMKFLIYAFLFVALASLVIGIVIGLAVKLIGMLVFGALVVAGILFLARLLRGAR